MLLHLLQSEHDDKTRVKTPHCAQRSWTHWFCVVMCAVGKNPKIPKLSPMDDDNFTQGSIEGLGSLVYICNSNQNSNPVQEEQTKHGEAQPSTPQWQIILLSITSQCVSLVSQQCNNRLLPSLEWSQGVTLLKATIPLMVQVCCVTLVFHTLVCYWSQLTLATSTVAKRFDHVWLQYLMNELTPSSLQTFWYKQTMHWNGGF